MLLLPPMLSLPPMLPLSQKICRAASLARDALIASGGITYERTGGQYVRVRDAAAGEDATAADAAGDAAASAGTFSLSLCKFYAKLCVPGETAGE